MRKLLFLLLFTLTLHAAVTLKANKPTGNASAGSDYGFLVLPGSQRQISTTQTGATTWKINWSILSTTGGATATLDRTTNAINLVNVTIGSVGATCSVSGSLGAYVVSSAATVTVRAQSVDDTTKTADFVFKVCNPAQQVIVTPAYRQVYPTQKAELQSFVIGAVDESGTWSQVSAPTGGDGTLSDTNKRDTVFSGTVTGRYTYRYTSAKDPTKSATAIVYVSANPIPAYGLSTPNRTVSMPCEVDPAFTGTLYEVGPARAYTTINSVPTNQFLAGSVIRIHNDDTTGSNPTVYHEDIRIMGLSGTQYNGTPTQPQLVCGVPDGNGVLPIIDGDNAVGAAWLSAVQQYGVVSVWGNAKGFNEKYSAGSDGTDYVEVYGLHIRNGNPLHNYIPYPNGTATPWNNFSACINVRSGTYGLYAGNELENCGNGMFVANNSARGFGQVTMFNTYEGNYFHNNGNNNDPGAHQIYTGAYFSVIQGNLFGELFTGSQGNEIKDRGAESIHRYNVFQTTEGGYLVGMESATDAQDYITAEAFLGGTGDMSCQNTYCAGETTFPIDVLAAYQEGLEKLFMYGNVYSSRSTLLADIKLSDSGGECCGSFHNQTEMGDHQGITYFYNNTVDNPMLAVLGTLSGTNNGSTPEQQFMKPTVLFANNIMYKANTGTINIFAFARNASIVGRWQTNLMNKGTFDITMPINGLPSTDTSAVNGWQNYTDQFQYDSDGVTYSGGSITIPIDTHQTGLTSGNFLQTPLPNQTPYNIFTYAPVTGAGAIGAGTAITDPVASLLPVRFQYDLEHSRVIPRTNALTIGAVDTGSQPTITALTPVPSTTTFLSTTLPTITSALYTPVPAKVFCASTIGLINDCSPHGTWTSTDTGGVPDTKLLFNANNAFNTANGPYSGYVRGNIQGAKIWMPYAYNGGTVPGPFTPPPPIIPLGLRDVRGLRFSFVAPTGNTFFVSQSSGSDSNPGTVSQPFQTLAKATTVMNTSMNSGDKILFKRGDIWHEGAVCGTQVTATSTTTLANTPPKCSGVTIGAYGTGNKPLFDAADTLTGLTWVSDGGGVYHSALGSNAMPIKLFADPPVSFDATTGFPPQLTPICNEVDSTYNPATTYKFLDCSLYYVHSGPASTIGVATTASNSAHIWTITGSAYPYDYTQPYLTSLTALPGSWYTDGTSVWVHLLDGSDPTSHVIEGTHRNYGLQIYGNNVTVDGIAVAHTFESGVMALAYTDSTMGGAYYTAERNTFKNLSVWNYGNIGYDYILTQGSAGKPLLMQCGLLMSAGMEPSPHYLYGNLITNNYVGTHDSYIGGRQRDRQAGICMLGNDGGGTNNEDRITNNYVATTNAQGIVYALNGLQSTTPNNGGAVKRNVLTQNEGNIFYTITAGGEVAYNHIYETDGEGLQLGGSSTSTLSVPQKIHHNLIHDTDVSKSTTLYNGSDCNGTGKNIFYYQNTFVNNYAANITTEGGCWDASIKNNLFDQNQAPWPSGSPARSNAYSYYYTSDSHTSGVVMDHNLWLPGTNTGPFKASSGDNHNCTTMPAFWPSTNDICISNGSAGYTNRAAYDFSLTTSSPAYQAGDVGQNMGAYDGTPNSYDPTKVGPQ